MVNNTMSQFANIGEGTCWHRLRSESIKVTRGSHSLVRQPEKWDVFMMVPNQAQDDEQVFSCSFHIVLEPHSLDEP